MKKEEKVRLINRLKERFPEFERKKEEARQKLENGQYASEKEKRELRDWAYESFPYGDVVSSMEEHLDSINLEKNVVRSVEGRLCPSFFFHHNGLGMVCWDVLVI